MNPSEETRLAEERGAPPLTDADLREMLRLADEATPGGWVYEGGSLHHWYGDGVLMMEWIENGRTSVKNRNREQDGRFMAAARLGWPRVIAELLKARADIARLQDLVRQLSERVAICSELLGKRAERKPQEKIDQC